MREPYLTYLETRGNVRVWLVDGTYIRDHLEEEFTDCGEHFHFPHLIPLNEIWVDNNNHPKEYQFCIDHQLAERKFMMAGDTYEVALHKADKIEKRERNRVDESPTAHVKIGTKDHYHRRILGRTKNHLVVWLVYGNLVRDDLDSEFTEGGHGLVYSYVPMGEVWIDDALHKDEYPYVIFHELFERNEMRNGMAYDPAHKRASHEEELMRHDPSRIGPELEKVGFINFSEMRR